MTAVEKLEISLLGLVSFDSEELRKMYKDRIAKAKENEKQQQGYSEEEVLNLLYYIRCNCIEVEEGWQINGEKFTDKELVLNFKNN